MLNTLLKLTKRLYPTGRAFRIPVGSNIEKIHKALNKSEEVAFNHATSGILDFILADNDNFTADHALVWERRLGILTNIDTTLDDRKAAIRRKYPGIFGRNPAKQHFLRLQGQLQFAGFNVFVHEQTADVPPTSILGGTDIQHGQVQHGQVNHGGGSLDKIANSIDPEIDRDFDLGQNFRALFYIGGATLGDFASIPITRQMEFRQLVLTLKPVQMIAFLFINYTTDTVSDFNFDFNQDFKS